MEVLGEEEEEAQKEARFARIPPLHIDCCIHSSSKPVSKFNGASWRNSTADHLNESSQSDTHFIHDINTNDCEMLRHGIHGANADP